VQLPACQIEARPTSSTIPYDASQIPSALLSRLNDLRDSDG